MRISHLSRLLMGWVLLVMVARPTDAALITFNSRALFGASAPGLPVETFEAGLVASGAVISVQVLNEFAAVARRKFGKTWAEIDETLQIVRSLVSEIEPLTVASHDAALAISARLDYGIYDAMIIASALHAGCDVLYSEDMQAGQVVDGIRITNPFAA